MEIFIFFSKYIFLIYALIFTTTSLLYIFNEKKYKASTNNNFQMTIIVFYHALSFFILSFDMDNGAFNIESIIFGLVGLLFILVYKAIMHFLYSRGDFIIINTILFLMDISIVFLYRLEPSVATRQLLWFFLGLLSLLLIPLLFKLFIYLSEKFKHFNGLFIVLIFTLIILPSFFGETTFGANNWISIPGLNISFQPSELVKLLYIFYLSLAFSYCKKFTDLFLPTIISCLCIIILVFQRDLGGALIFFITYLFLLYATTSSEILFLLGLGLASIASIISYQLFSHVQVRVEAWANPWASPYNRGLQILQSLFAIGTWGPFGSGLTKGYPKYVPIIESDFIFAGICEEFGGIFGILIVVMFFTILHRGIAISKKSDKIYLTLLGLGITTMITFQSFLIIGGNIKLIPLTGVTLPFVSYGGTSSFISIIMIGILLQLNIFNIATEEAADEYDFEENYHKIINGNISRIYLLLLLLFLLTAGYLGKFIFIDSKTITNSTYNPRISVNDIAITRGKILDSNDVVLAYSEEKRIYPYGRIFSHVIGFNTNGKSGVESAYNFTLQKPNNEIFQRIRQLLFDDKILGNNLKLTIDKDLQEYVYNQLGNQKGAIIVQEPSTGKILSMVSYNNFEPNNVEDNWDILNNMTEETPLVNRASQGLYPPGSVFKIVSAVAIINNMSDYKNYSYDCTGSITIDGETLTCNNSEVHGLVNLDTAFTVSCNSYFAKAINEIGSAPLIETADAFYFNQSFDFDLPHLKSEFTLSETDNTALQMHTSIGQGNTLVTPLYLSMINSAIANNGIMMKPLLVDKALSYNNKVLKSYSPSTVKEIISSNISKELKDMMENVILEGTGRNSALINISSGGKTGTAEVTDARSHGLFVAFAPVENPEISITIVLENSGGSGSTLGIGKNIMNYYFENK